MFLLGFIFLDIRFGEFGRDTNYKIFNNAIVTNISTAILFFMNILLDGIHYAIKRRFVYRNLLILTSNCRLDSSYSIAPYTDKNLKFSK